MKKIQNYIPNVLLTFLLVFALLGAELLGIVQAVALSPATFDRITEQEQLGDKAYAALEKTFTSRSHSTGIPAEVFLDTLTPEQLEQGIRLHTEELFAELHDSDCHDFGMDFSAMEDSVRTFFNSYAEENGIAKDEAFESKVDSVIAESQTIIDEAADPFRFGTMRRNGWIGKARGYLQYVQPGLIGCIVLAVVLMGLLFLCNRKQKAHLAYWYGLAALVGGILLLLPCVWLKGSDYFAGFTLKDPQIYAAVVGLLRLLTDRALALALITAVCGIIGIVVFAVLQKQKKQA